MANFQSNMMEDFVFGMFGVRSSSDPVMNGILTYIDAPDDEKDEQCLRKLLEQNSSKINNTIKMGMPYMHMVCANSKGTPALVDILIEYGADIRLENMFGQTPMEIAINVHRDEAFLLALAERGALNCVGQSTPPYFCLAVERSLPMAFIDAIIQRKGFGTCLKEYDHGGSVYRCALDYTHPSGTVNILKKLDENGLKPDRDTDLICFAIERGHDFDTISFLRGKGCPFECSEHESVWGCFFKPQASVVTGDLTRLLMRENPVKIALSGLFDLPISPLQLVLYQSRYEIEAIELMLDDMFTGTDINAYVGENRNSLLHYAGSNAHCLPNVLDLLIRRGVNVNNVNNEGMSCLEDILAEEDVPFTNRPGMVKILLENGAQLTHSIATMALSKCPDLEIFRILLGTGIPLGLIGYKDILNGVMNREGNPDKVKPCIEYLLTCMFLELSDCELPTLNINSVRDMPVPQFRAKCAYEVARMKSKRVGTDRNLWDLFSADGTLRGVVTTTEQKMANFGLLLRVIRTDPYPLLLPAIADRVGRPAMARKLEVVPVYTICHIENDIGDGKKQIMEKSIHLNEVCRMVIAQNLEEPDLLNLLLAFFKPSNQGSTV